MSSSSTADTKVPQPWFVTTHWSVVLSAREPNSAQSAAALEALCQVYWYPLYAFVRRQGHSPHDAQDLTQGFFGKLLEKDYLQAADRERGRFRTFLLVALKRFLANEWDRARAAKRGGGRALVPLDTESAETRYQVEPAAELSADRIYDRRWALTLLEQTLARLRTEYSAAGRDGEFDRLKLVLTADRGSIDYAVLAADLGQTEGAARVAVHRLRKRFREIFRDGIAHTVANAGELEAEMRHLLAALGEEREE